MFSLRRTLNLPFPFRRHRNVPLLTTPNGPGPPRVRITVLSRYVENYSRRRSRGRGGRGYLEEEVPIVRTSTTVSRTRKDGQYTLQSQPPVHSDYTKTDQLRSYRSTGERNVCREEGVTVESSEVLRSRKRTVPSLWKGIRKGGREC